MTLVQAQDCLMLILPVWQMGNTAGAGAIANGNSILMV